MLRSMYSAISGMQGFETKLDVIGNNIANVNTYGFKASRVNFSDILSQTLSGASKPSSSTVGAKTYYFGGTNPEQVGLGMKVASIDTEFTQGADATTGVDTDLAINGDGLFVVTQDGGKSYNYTRVGDFSVDANGDLVLPNGAVAMGYISNASNGPQSVQATNPSGGAVDPKLQPVNIASYCSQLVPAITPSSSPDLQIGKDGSLSISDSNGNRQTIGYLVIATPPNPSGLEKSGDSKYQLSPDSGLPSVPTSVVAAPGNNMYFQAPTQNGSGYLQAGALEMSNVDLTREFTEMIVAQRGFDANSKMIGTDNAILNDIVNLKNG